MANFCIRIFLGKGLLVISYEKRNQIFIKIKNSLSDNKCEIETIKFSPNNFL